MQGTEIERRQQQAAAEFSEIVEAGGTDDVWVVAKLADTLSDYLAGSPEVWGKFKALVQTKAAGKRAAAYLKENAVVKLDAARRAAQYAFSEWTVGDAVDASQHGLFFEAESAGQRRRLFVVAGAGGEWVVSLGEASVAVPAGVIE